MTDITAIILTHNSQSSLGETLSSLKFAKNILVVDDHSTDDTAAIAKKHGARVLVRSLNGDWASQRNYALAHADTDWILFIDSDEVVTKELKQEITRLNPGSVDGYYLKRLDIFHGHTLYHGETGQIKLLRLARRDSGTWSRPVHETWDVTGNLKTLSQPLLHIRDLSITTFVSRLDRYSTIDSQQFARQPFRYLTLLKPLFKFVYNYIYLLGFLDGFAGLTFAYLMSFYSLTVRIKTWETVSSKSAS